MDVEEVRRREYEDRIRAHQAEGRRLDRALVAMARWRVLVFALATLGVAGAGGPVGSVALLVLAGPLFLLLVLHHRRLRELHEIAGEYAALNGRALARMERGWDRLPLPEPLGVVDAALSRDLHVFGHASLYHLVCTANTDTGRRQLTRWLQQTSSAAEALARQRSVWCLAGQLDLRQELERRTGRVARERSDTGQFLRWAAARDSLLGARRLRAAARVLAAASTAAVLYELSAPGVNPAWIPLVACNLTAALVFYRRTAAAIESVGSSASALGAYRHTFQLAEQAPAAGAHEVPAQRFLARDRPSRHISRLLRVVELGEVRRQPVLSMVLQALLLWDLQIACALEGWRRAHGERMRRCLEKLGEMEALASLAGLAHDNPDWVYPELGADGDTRFTARGLAHPLIPTARRVANDVEIGSPGALLLVTGTNMSGKSTFLRAIGLNAVLARAGAPVCARQLCMSEVRVRTSFSVEDSLPGGVSLFMAEVLRLQAIMAEARASAPEPTLFLLDELLRGTNSKDRHEATGVILDQLLATGAIGAISSHDVALADLPALRVAMRTAHFRDTLRPAPGGGAELSFDYVLRPGPSTSTNALVLLGLAGLGAGRGTGRAGLRAARVRGQAGSLPRLRWPRTEPFWRGRREHRTRGRGGCPAPLERQREGGGPFLRRGGRFGDGGGAAVTLAAEHAHGGSPRYRRTSASDGGPARLLDLPRFGTASRNGGRGACGACRAPSRRHEIGALNAARRCCVLGSRVLRGMEWTGRVPPQGGCSGSAAAGTSRTPPLPSDVLPSNAKPRGGRQASRTHPLPAGALERVEPAQLRPRGCASGASAAADREARCAT